eukprot:Pgem_evm1s5585
MDLIRGVQNSNEHKGEDSRLFSRCMWNQWSSINRYFSLDDYWIEYLKTAVSSNSNWLFVIRWMQSVKCRRAMSIRDKAIDFSLMRI